MRAATFLAVFGTLLVAEAFIPSHVSGSATRRSSFAVRAMRMSQEPAKESRGVDRKGFMQQAALLGSLVSLLPTAAQAKGVKRVKNAPLVTLDSGVTYQEMAIGSGPSPQLGDRVAVHYSLYYNGFEVESSRDSSGLAARPYGFNWGTETGSGAMVKGVQQGMKGMQVGGRRKITVPPELAFGKKGVPPFIPADATVLFDVSIWSIKPAGTNPNLTLSGSQNYF